ncbi:hypothetical protein [Deinococcus aquatilis]|uniref:hypothetical protein n=1 Tax=Deinococcus aquatilis TaxID=519440 RepID=UPI0012FC9B12|nr:hypothetical protein [Deinococcus aquatilis]
MSGPTVEDIRSALQERVMDVVKALFPDAKREGTTLRVPNVSEQVTVAGQISTGLIIEVVRAGAQGLWHDVGTGEQGGMFDLIMASRSVDFQGALQWACEFVGRPMPIRSFSGPKTKEGVLHDTANPRALDANKRRLMQQPEAQAYLRGAQCGLTQETIAHFQLGLTSYTAKASGKVVYHDALSFPQLDSAGQARSRFLRSWIPDVTSGGKKKGDWASGEPSTYWVTPSTGRQSLLICEGAQDGWRLWQAVQGTPLAARLCIISPTHGSVIPEEWRAPAFWASWDAVYVGQGADEAGDLMALRVREHALRDVQRVRVPEGRGKDWTEFFNGGGTVVEFQALLQDAPVTAPRVTETSVVSVVPDEDGTFQVAPVDLSRAFVNGYLYYPFRSGESRTVDGRRSLRWRDQVLRSDGTICKAEYLWAEPGTPRADWMLALDDGTILTKMPSANPLLSTFTTNAITRFSAARRLNRSALTLTPAQLLTQIDQHLRAKVILPYDHDFAILTYVAVTSYVQSIFEAVPLVLVMGMAGSGKSELGAAIAELSCNAVILNGQTSAASVARALDSAGGLAVIDDLEGIGSITKNKSDYGELVQQLKVSYKKATAKKKWTNTKTMRLEELNFYGVKIINNTEGADAILGSRMLKIYTKKISRQGLGDYTRPPELSPEQLVDLRNNLHIWAMEQARDIDALYQQQYKRHDERQEEITAPLRLLAAFMDEPVFAGRLASALQMQEVVPEPVESSVEVLERAVKELIRQGYRDAIAMPQLEFEMRRITGSTPWGMSSTTKNPKWQEPRWVGRQLRMMMVIDPVRPDGRPRLWGQQIRTYALEPGFVAETLRALQAEGVAVIAEPLGVLEYCQVQCLSCPYSAFCSFQETKMAQIEKHGTQVGKFN